MNEPTRPIPSRLSLVFLMILALFVAPALAADPPADGSDSLPAAKPPRVAAKKGGVEAEGDDATARLLWQRREFGVPTPEFKRKLLQERARRKSLEASAARVSTTAAAGTPSASVAASSSGPTWVPIGPEGADYESNGPYTGFVRDSGRARKFLPHPTDPDTLYFLTSGGGLWVTHNFTAAATTWTPLTDSLPTTGGGSVAFGRTPSVLYLGLGDPFDVINIGGAMVNSTDGGQTWTSPVDLGSAFSVRDILVDTSGTSDVLLVATDDGLYRSVDSGASYSKVLGGSGQLFQGLVFWSLARTSAGVIASAQSCTGVPAASCGTIGGLYVSTDLGATWAAIPNGGGAYSGAGRTTLAVGAPGDAVVYAYAETAASTDQLDMFRSTDGGLNWTALGINGKVPANSNADNPNMDLMASQSWYNQMILVDPRDATRNTIYLGGQLGSAKTIDGGATWTLLTNWLPFNRFTIPYVHADFHAAALDLAGTPTLLFGTDGGIFVSADGGATWSSDKNNGLQTFLLYSMTSTPGFPSAVAGGSQDNGTRVRKGNTKIYNQSFGGDGTGTGWSQGNTNMFVTSIPGNVYATNLANRIPDLIASYFVFSAPLANDSLFEIPVTLPSPSLDPTGKTFYSASGTRLDLFDFSANPPASYILGQFGPYPSVSLRSAVHGIGVSPVDLNHLGVAASGGYVELTSNGGASWTGVPLNSAVTGYASYNESVTWVDNQTIFATSVAPAAGAVRVVKSVDGGVTWARSDTGLPDVQVERILVDPRDATKNSFFAATFAGVYRSVDGGASWSPFGTGLPSAPVSDLYLPPDGSFVRVATYGRGFWEIPFLSYVGATLADDLYSFDHDGVLDDRETGHLTVTLHNDGSVSLSAVSATITSSNPSVSFPAGNVLNFPPAAPFSDTTASVETYLSGATGVQRIDFTIAFNDASLGLPGPVTATASFRANTDEVPNSSASDDVEAAGTAWTVAGSAPSAPDLQNWKRIQITPLEYRWIEIDSNVATDQTLVSPVMTVGSGTFVISFEQRYEFDWDSTPAYYDGMVLEISTDGGATWTDIGAFATPGYDHVLAVGGGNVLEGRPAYSGQSANYPTPFIPVTVNLGTAYAGRSVLIRFRVGTDSLGPAEGVELRNIAASGITNTPFTALVADRQLCAHPSEVQNLAWSSDSTLVWNPDPAASNYELYSDLLSNLPGGFGTCLDSSISSATATDTTVPPSGAGWFYLVTSRNVLHEESTKGFGSNGTQRSNAAPCP